MKKLFIVFLNVVFALVVVAQDLPKDVEKVYKNAERLKSKKELNPAVAAYKEVLRSVDHVPSMISIAEIEMFMRKPANYRMAYEYYDMAIKALDAGIASATKKSHKKYMTEQRDELIPRRKNAKSHVKDFDNAKEQKMGGKRLLEDPDLE